MQIKIGNAPKNKLPLLSCVNETSGNGRELLLDREALHTDISASVSFHSGTSLKSVIQLCRRRIRSWRIPPNWHRDDWFEEIGAIETMAAWQAGRRYDISSGIKYEAFVYQTVMAVVLTHYRREWRYALRFVSTDERVGRPLTSKGASDSEDSIDIDNVLQCASSADNRYLSINGLHSALKTLSTVQQQLIKYLYVFGYSEAEIGKTFGISQRAINKRKHVILKLLRDQLL